MLLPADLKMASKAEHEEAEFFKKLKNKATVLQEELSDLQDLWVRPMLTVTGDDDKAKAMTVINTVRKKVNELKVELANIRTVLKGIAEETETFNNTTQERYAILKQGYEDMMTLLKDHGYNSGNEDRSEENIENISECSDINSTIINSNELHSHIDNLSSAEMFSDYGIPTSTPLINRQLKF